MKIIKRYIPFLLFAFSGIAGYVMLVSAFNVILQYIVTVLFALILFSLLLVTSKISWTERLSFASSYFGFGISSWGFFLFLEQDVFQYLTIALIAIVSYLYAENVYRFIYMADKYQVSALTNLIRYISLLSLFFGFVTFFDIRFFFAAKWLYLLIALFFFALMNMYPVFWSIKVSIKSAFGYSLVVAMLLTELVFSVTYWPHIPLVKGIVTLAFSYAMMQILIMTLTDQLDRKKIFRTLGVAALVLILTLSTAQWV